ncbi:MAG: AMP-binding protein [Planctomycetota bacterium]|jgi:fatty-acyl-CoA synthase
MVDLSYVQGTSDLAFLGETIGRCLDRIADTYPDQPAVISVPQSLRFSYREFNHVVNRAAKAFLRLGIQPGDRVAIWSTNNYEWVTAQYATARIGAVLVNVNPAYRTHELEYVLQQSQAKVLLLIESFKTSNYPDMFYQVCPEARECEPGHLDSWRFPHLKTVVFIGSNHFPGMLTRRAFAELGDELPDHEVAEREATLDIDDVINIQYTSGTTGFPKGVMLTHHNIINNGFHVGRIMKLSEQDRVCVPVPFYHCFGMVISNLAAMTHGAAVVIPSPAFDASATLAAVQEERCTVLHGVPTMFIAELDHPEFATFDLRSLRTGIMAGAPCPIELMRRVVDRMHMKEILIAYGQTEASPVTTLTRPDDPLERRVSTVGTVMPQQELKIIDVTTGATLPLNVQGEVCTRGYNVMRGYDHDGQATADAIDEAGWLHSGDLGEMNDEGYVRITGRIKEMLIRGGENIYPREIEEFLHTLDEIADVQVVGVPDKKYGEELLACVKLNPEAAANPPDQDQFRTLCKGRIAHFKIPRYWMVVDEFPMTVTGKVQKFKIRELAIQHFQLSDISTVQASD